MTDKELHKLSRTELLEIMLQQQKEIERLQDELEKAKSLIESRKMLMRKAGSIADAALKISEVFEAAQNAADRYLMSVKASAEHGVLETEEGPEGETAQEEAPAEEAPAEEASQEEAPEENAAAAEENDSPEEPHQEETADGEQHE